MDTRTLHSELVGGGLPAECTCPREACGAVVETPDCPVPHARMVGEHHWSDQCPEGDDHPVTPRVLPTPDDIAEEVCMASMAMTLEYIQHMGTERSRVLHKAIVDTLNAIGIHNWPHHEATPQSQAAHARELEHLRHYLRMFDAGLY